MQARKMLFAAIPSICASSSKKISIYNEEMIVARCFIGFIIFSRKSLGKTFKVTLDGRIQAIQEESQQFPNPNEVVPPESNEQQRLLRISLQICGTVVESLPMARCAPKCEKTVQALLCRNLNVKSVTLPNATSSRRIRLQDDLVTGFHFSKSGSNTKTSRTQTSIYTSTGLRSVSSGSILRTPRPGLVTFDPHKYDNLSFTRQGTGIGLNKLQPSIRLPREQEARKWTEVFPVGRLGGEAGGGSGEESGQCIIEKGDWERAGLELPTSPIGKSFAQCGVSCRAYNTFSSRIFFLRAKSPEKRRDSEKRESLSWHYKDHFTQSEEVLQKSLAEEHVYGILKPHGYQLQVSIRELFSAIKASKAP
ncbi:hypothetical protein AgCh_025088 [Apium graveolens]